MSRKHLAKLKLNSEIMVWGLLVGLYLISLINLWPGIVSPDAVVQYKAAVSGIYNDHHPPAMSLLWRYLDKIYPGPGLVFAFHLTLLYLAAAIFVYMFRDSKFKWWYAVYPVIPNMLAYTSLIVKDTGFAYCYLLAGAILAFLMCERPKKYTHLLMLLTVVLLFYGTAVKFQAKYLLFFFTIGIGYCWYKYKLTWRAIFAGLVLYLLLLGSIVGFNAVLVPKTQESHSWQLVKLYDLTAMGIALNQPLYPEFVMQKPGYSFARVKKLFDPREIDSLVFPADSVLKAGANEQERTILWNTWFSAVKKHPGLYLKIRFRLWSFNLTTSPSDRSNPVEFLSKAALAPYLQNAGVSHFIEGTFNLFKISLRFMWLFPLLLLYTYLGFKYFKQARSAPPLLMLCLTSLALLAILFCFSMYGTARYVFICTCFVHAAHGLAYRAWRRAP